MTADRKAAPDRPAVEAPSRGEPRRLGLAQLAKRISVWTSRWIVSAVILIAGLAFGRQVLYWWGSDRAEDGASPPQSVAAGALGDLRAEHTLEFGDTAWRMSRQLVAVDEGQVLRELQGRCAAVLRECAAPSGEPGPAERDFLKRVAGQKPAQEQAGQWRLFALDAAFPMVIGTRKLTPSPGVPGDRLVSGGERVVTWGLAAPSGGKAWTLYTFQPAPPAGGESPFSELPTPPGSRRTLLIRAADGGAVVSFRGHDSPNECKRFVDSWLAANGWRATGQWQPNGATWSLRCTRAVDNRRDSLDVLLVSDGSGEMTGLVLRTPLSNALSKGERP
jgi:hypothetical protein